MANNLKWGILMNYCLWLNGIKVNTAKEIETNFDLASIRGYFLAGTLLPWLYHNQGREYAVRLATTSLDDPLLNVRICLAFNQSLDKISPHKCEENSDTHQDTTFPLPTSLGSYALFGSYNRGSFGSFLKGSFSGSYSSFGYPKSFTYRKSSGFQGLFGYGLDII